MPVFSVKLSKSQLMDTVEIEVESNFQTIIRSGKAEFNLNGLDPEEYPHLPIIEEENIFKLPTDL